MKTTIEIDDDLFRRTKAEAALRGRSLKDLFTEALTNYLDERPPSSEPRIVGWRRVFGAADASMVAPVDAIVTEEFGNVDPHDWE